MEIRFGYVAMSMELENASPSKTITVKTYTKLAETDQEAALNKVRRIVRENLNNTRRLLLHNRANGVMVYRFSSRLFPLATHPLLEMWNYIEDLKVELKVLGDLVKENRMRVSFHPDHYTLLNSPREEVIRASLTDLAHHDALLVGMGLDQQAKLVTHVGGGYHDKTVSLKRFEKNWDKVPKSIAERLVLENDDKTFNAEEVLSLCQRLPLPMVLDLHHLYCNPSTKALEELLPDIFDTWKNTGLTPKIHISSPKDSKDFRSHHEYVNPEDVYPFLQLARELIPSLDVMVEAKQKDRAMFQLVEALSKYPGMKSAGPAALLME